MEIKSVDLVSTLQWKSINEECLICNNPIGNNCIKCDSNISNLNCLSVMNSNDACKHSYHLHCLTNINKNKTIRCPMCNIEWSNK